MLLVTALFLGICVFFTVETVRKLPGIQELALRGVKPFGCNVCMSFWTTLAWYLPALIKSHTYSDIILGPAAAGVSLILLYMTDAFMVKPPILPQD